MISFNDAIKARIDNADERVTQAAELVREWIITELTLLAEKHAATFETFLNSVPSLLEERDDIGDFNDYFYLINDKEYLVHYNKDYIFLTVDIRKSVPEDILAALKVSKLVDVPQFDQLLLKIPFTVKGSDGSTLIDTYLNLSQVGYSYSVNVSLVEFTYPG